MEITELNDEAVGTNAEGREARLIELEVRSEERRADVDRLEEFVRGFENRIARLEQRVVSLHERIENQPDDMPTPTEDLPPHY